MHGKQLLSSSQSGRGSTALNVEVLSEAGDASDFHKEVRKFFCHHITCRNRLDYLRNRLVAPVTMPDHEGEKRLSRSWSTGTNTSSSRSGGPGQSCDTIVDANRCGCLDRPHSSVPDYLLEKLYGADSSTTRPRPIRSYDSNSGDS